VFNLLVSIILVFLAIKTIPIAKWLFFFLGIMPMTLYQFSSLSYDALTIGISFLLTATILNYALNNEKRIGPHELIILFLLSGLLAGSKPPYFIIAFLFLIIPVEKLGSWKKFTLIFAALISTVVIVSQLWAPGRVVFERLGISNEHRIGTASVYSREENILLNRRSLHYPLKSSLPLLPHGYSDVKASDDPVEAKTGETKPGSPILSKDGRADRQHAAISPFDPAAQKKFILEDPVRYTGIMWHTVHKSLNLYMVSFVGMFGWIDTTLPDFLVYVYLSVLLLVSIVFPVSGMQISIVRKCVLLAVFAAVFVLVETAMYLYCNPVGAGQIIAVQGRYFIAVGPLLFLLFYQGKTHKMFDKYLLSSKLFSWFAVVFGSCFLIFSLWVIFERFYVLTI
jgi:uncharacterized membrane protein